MNKKVAKFHKSVVTTRKFIQSLSYFAQNLEPDCLDDGPQRKVEKHLNMYL